MAKAKYVLTATRADGQSVSKIDRALGVVSGVAVYSDADLNARLGQLKDNPGVTVTVRNAND